MVQLQQERPAGQKMYAPIVIKKRKMTLMRKLFILSFTIIPVIHFLLFYVYINLDSFAMGFQKTVGNETQWTLEHFAKVFEVLGDSQSELRLAFKNTFLTFFISLLMYPVGIIVSYFLYKKIRGHNVFRILFYLPTVVSGVVFAFVYKKLCEPEGPLSLLVQNLDGLEIAPALLADSEYANTFIWVMMIWTGFPGAMIIWGGTFARIPDSVLEYAKLDGVGWLRELVQIILPMVWPTFSLFLVLQLTGIFNASGNVFLLTPDATKYKTQTLSNWFYMQVYSTSVHPQSNTFNYMSAFGLLLTVVACTLSLIVRKGLVKLVPDVDF